ncbi:hypothetical protein MALG_01479 [Marinovum algicola DG 898]|nr:hypothetical protein MALG_01479 [Marinovum algicola DG 898]
MNLLSNHWALMRGKPVISQSGGSAELRAVHRRARSGEEEPRVVRFIGLAGIPVILLAHYGPEIGFDESSNVLLDSAEFAVVGLLNAAERLGTIAEAQSLDVPLESLRGWALASLWAAGAWAIRSTRLIDLLGWVVNRETVSVRVSAEEVTVRRRALSLGKRIKREVIRDVLVITESPHGHEVVILHDDGVLNVASIHGEKSRALFFKMRLDDLLADPCNRNIDKAANSSFGGSVQ